jgi:hypothetical protein
MSRVLVRARDGAVRAFRLTVRRLINGPRDASVLPGQPRALDNARVV